jgi:hypothetical protein
MNVALGCYEGDEVDGRALPDTPLTWRPTVVFIAWMNAVGHKILWRNDAMPGESSISVVPGTAEDNNIQSLTDTGWTVGDDVDVNKDEGILCYYAWNDAWGAAAHGAYAGNGDPNHTITIGWGPDVVLVQANTTGSTANTRYAWVTTADNSTGTACSLSAASAIDDCTTNYITRLLSDGFKAGSNLNLAGANYYWIALKKQPSISRWLWTHKFTGEGDADQDIDVGGQARMIIVHSDATGSECAGLRHDQDDIDADANPYLQRSNAGDLSGGINVGTSGGFNAADECNEAVDFYSWGFYEPSNTPTATATDTPTVTPTSTPTSTPSPVATDSCCYCGEDDCVDPAGFGVGNECPRTCTPIPQAACVEVP